MSQEKLADALGLTFQQVQKYERGANRIGAGRLWELSRALDVPVSYFFEDVAGGSVSAATPAGMAEAPAPYADDPMSRRETLLLVRAYYAIPEGPVRRRMLDLMKSLAAEPAQRTAGDEEEPARGRAAAKAS